MLAYSTSCQFLFRRYSPVLSQDPSSYLRPVHLNILSPKRQAVYWLAALFSIITDRLILLAVQ
jgi:hypothetical protein